MTDCFSLSLHATLHGNKPLNIQEAIMPSYKEYTAHFSKAKRYTYNYKTIDIAISEAYNQGYTAQQIADSLREPLGRIQYRVQVLLQENIIKPKYDTRKAYLRSVVRMLESDLAKAKAELAS